MRRTVLVLALILASAFCAWAGGPSLPLDLSNQPSWVTVTLSSPWTNVGTPFAAAGYFKDSLGIVHLRGLITSGTDAAAFILPAGCRPAARVMKHDRTAYVQVLTDGTVFIGSSDGLQISLDGISFRAEQ